MWNIINIIKYVWKSILVQFKILWAKIRKQKVDVIVIKHIVDTKVKTYLVEFFTKAVKSKDFQNSKRQALWITKNFDSLIKKVANIYIFKDNKKATQLRKLFQAIIDQNPENDKWAVSKIVDLTINEIWKNIKKDKYEEFFNWL